MKLDFVIIGGMKCGSTAIGEYFKMHPEVNFCDMIETDYFSHNNQKIASLDDYFNTYYDSKNRGLKGESSPTYSYLNNLPRTALKLKTHNKDLKIIFVVRNPYKRINSHLNHKKLENEKVASDLKAYLQNNGEVIEKTKFGSILKHYMDVFDHENVKVLKFEDVINGIGLHEACDFLGITFHQERLPEANKTDKRFYNLPVITFYKRNFMFFSQVPGFKFIKKPLKGFIDNVFSKKMKADDYISIDKQTEKYIAENLTVDSKLFESLTGFNYFNLKK